MLNNPLRQQLMHRILTCTAERFELLALDVFRYQYERNTVYRAFVQALGLDASKIHKIEEIPFLPIELFKDHQILCEGLFPALVFESSGTTGQQRSRHYVADPAWYATVSRQIFERLYGPLSNFHILALLPSYLERQTSSLVWMVRHFIEQSRSEASGFYLYNYEELLRKVEQLKKQADGRRILLIGVSFALLELAERHAPDLSGLIVIETGGMKGRRQELLREELHALLCEKMNLRRVHSEYGMTELLSQAYSKGEGIFDAPPWMRVLLREPNDPLTLNPRQRAGAVNIIDLANIDSCAFIATQDMGSLLPDGRFRITGRMDFAEQRGCNMLLWQ
ncbi:MAG: acyltransferase [Thermonema sp.]|uniref:LuxE/PaaK family acyltransferase n=1 Tax=Thermonema sp. TaxID=2231181 RepID=UPI0021DE83E8|nr:acyl transferase [Thermonema sp.]GIV39295.1 MAG: acyltransferase [Thermonema sp.]